MNAISYSYVALLDVLAYREYLNRDTASGKLEFRDAMSRALAVFQKVNQTDFGHTAISDTIIITCARQEHAVEFLRLLKQVVISFLQQGLFLRGAAVYARHFQSGNLTYSPALTIAYKLEQELAIYPRVIVDKNIVEMLKSSGQEKKLVNSALIAEWNGVQFLNVLDAKTWPQVFKAAKTLFTRDAANLAGKESAFAKHVWFENYVFSSKHVKKGCKRYIPHPTLLGT